MKSYIATFEVKSTEQYFAVVLLLLFFFCRAYKVVLIFESMDETL